MVVRWKLRAEVSGVMDNIDLSAIVMLYGVSMQSNFVPVVPGFLSRDAIL